MDGLLLRHERFSALSMTTHRATGDTWDRLSDHEPYGRPARGTATLWVRTTPSVAPPPL